MCLTVRFRLAANEPTTRLRVRHAHELLAQAGILDGPRNARLSVRMQDRLLQAARLRSGIEGESELVTAGLASLAAQEDFGAWLVRQRGTLSDDFATGLED